MTFGKWRLIWTDGLNVSRFYCFPDITKAVLGHLALVRGEEPVGWLRHMPELGEFIYPE